MSKKKFLLVATGLVAGAAVCISKAFKKDDYIEAEGAELDELEDFEEIEETEEATENN